MSYPTFIWYPDGSVGTREDTALTEELSDLQVNPARTRAMGVAVGGRHSSTVLSAAMQEIRIISESMSGTSVDALVRDLWAFQAHLARGRACGFTRDTAKSWAGYCTTSPARGDTVLYTGGDAWYYAGTATLAQGDELVIEGLGAEGKREHALVQSVSGGNITLQGGLLQSYADATVMVRWHDYYPALVWPSSFQNARTSILTHDRRLNWTLDITLETDPDLLAALEEGGDSPLAGTTELPGSLTLEGLRALDVGSKRYTLPWRINELE